MNINSYIELIETVEENDAIYLLEQLSENTGFFTSQKKLVFIEKDNSGYRAEGIDTEYLKLQTHVNITSIRNNQAFSSGFYNLIIYKGDLLDDNIDAFIRLCKIYSSNTEKLDFKEFFYSLIALLQLPTEQEFKNAVGLFGELAFMLEMRMKYNKDVSTAWHKRGTYSKYDFSNDRSCLEVKTSITGYDVTIKHQQIFDVPGCHLVAVICKKDDTGKSIQDLLDEMESDCNFFKDLNYYLNVAKEVKRISPSDITDLKFIVNEIKIMDCDQINPFVDVPEEISKLSYNFNISTCCSLDDEEISSLIENY